MSIQFLFHMYKACIILSSQKLKSMANIRCLKSTLLTTHEDRATGFSAIDSKNLLLDHIPPNQSIKKKY